MTMNNQNSHVNNCSCEQVMIPIVPMESVSSLFIFGCIHATITRPFTQ